MKIIIEPVKSNEIKLLAEISRETFCNTFDQYNSKENMDMFLEKNLTVDALQNETRDQKNAFFFARIENEIAGHLKISASRTAGGLSAVGTLEIVRLYALKERIGSGVGKALMEFAISSAMAQSKKTIWLGVWEHNQRAISFYERFGFKKFSEHIFMLGNDRQTDWLMKKELE